MPQLSSPLSTPAGMAGVNPAHVGKMAGTRLHFPTFAAFTAAITSGATGYASDLWSDGQEMTIADEADTGAVRVWRTSLAHARTVRVGGATLVLAGNTNLVIATSGVPASGTGSVGDLAIDAGAGLYYTKGAGGWSSAAFLYPASGARNPNGVILFGDSRSQYEQNFQVVNANGGTYNNARGVFMQANAMADQRMKLIRNAGVGGNTYADLRARYLTDVRPYAVRASVLIIVCGINDITATVMRTLPEIQADANWIYDRAEEDRLLIIETADYCPGAGKEWDVTRNATWFALNDWKRSLPQSRKGFYLQDWAKVLVTPTAATPNVSSADLIDPAPGTALHINGQAAFRAAKYGGLVEIIKLLVPAHNKLVSSISDNYGYDPSNPNILDIGLFQGTSGTNDTGAANDGAPAAGFTAGVASGWKVKRNKGALTIATSVGPASSGIGNAQRLKVTGATADDDTIQLLPNADLTPRVMAGGRYQARCRVVISAPVGLHAVYLRIYVNIGGTIYQWRSLAETVPRRGAIPEAVTYTLETPDDMVLPAGAVTLFEVSLMAVWSGAGSGTIDVEQFSCPRLGG